MRLQLHREFTFADATRVVPYLHTLGVSHLYASPILTARSGSMHGYDVTNPTDVNPELGGEDGLRALVKALRAAGLGLIVDIVPNHMAVGHDNPWWYDVLRLGHASRYAGFFDIDWESADPSLRGKVLAPFLGKPYGEALAAGELSLGREGGLPVIRYYDAIYPIDPDTWDDAPASDDARFDSATPAGREALHALLERQHYRLAWWGAAADEINWRRFFDINGLVGLRIEQDEVFEATHATLLRLYAEGMIDGVRVDHVDGLSDPPGYCRRLRQRLEELAASRPAEAASGPAYLVVEKILGVGEPMPDDWAVDGTSGYDFMDAVSLVQHDPAAAPALEGAWAAVSGRSATFEPEETRARREILTGNFYAQLDATASALHDVARQDLATRDISRVAIRRALVALLAHFPVYRSYDAGRKRSPQDDAAFAKALPAAKADSPVVLHPVLDRLDAWLGGVAPPPGQVPLYARAATRFQQLSAPVAAKAVEDTAFYRYGRLLSRNDVGFDAARLGSDATAFHATCAEKAALFPHALLATATHDHKRGEDVRARLAVLSEMPDAWDAAVRRWQGMNATHKADRMPSPGDEAMLYQMIVGAWPADLAPEDAAGVAAFADRLAAWQEKALREAKLETNWTTPNAAYEDAARGFLAAILAPGSAFLAEAAAFVRRIGSAGAVNGLAQVLLKATTPGVPDFFQGTEFWDFSLVDPDNRRPVDFAARIEAAQADAAPAALAASWQDGRVKQAVILRTLAARRERADVFAQGSYTPVSVTGPFAEHVVAFLREHAGQRVLVLAPRLPAALLDGESLRIPPDAWQGTGVAVPAGRWTNRLTGAPLVANGGSIPVADLLRELPVALLATD
ncbi:MAG: malto-oligosyltrehalose synthase [Rhodospirillales bacterium]|nr:malto-oligosyltrehalose synthase [Rhodospirillales bacterium]